jgi:hypothetical protein
VPSGAKYAGVKMVSEATALEVTHTSLRRSKVDWDALLQQVYKRYKYTAQSPLSIFGRAFAAPGYGLAKILYAAEYAGLPPEPALPQLVKTTAALVDRGVAPVAPGRQFAGVAAEMLGGNPKEGGFGCLHAGAHLAAHVRALHAMWAVRLHAMQGSSEEPWVHVARHRGPAPCSGSPAAVCHSHVPRLAKAQWVGAAAYTGTPGSRVQCTAKVDALHSSRSSAFGGMV